MRADNPLVSIIVPIYKVESYIEQCIESLINQTYKNLEIILVDDGSPDKSGEICDRYAQYDSRIIVIHKENGGPSSAREEGIGKAAGIYLMLVDGDDWIDGDTVSVCVQQIEKIPDLECILFAYVKEYPDNSIPVQIMDNDSLLVGREAEDRVYRRLFGLSNEELSHPERMHNIESCCMKLYKRDYAEKGRFFDTKVVGSSEDALFNMYALYGLNKACYINRFFYHYRKLPLSITNSYRPNLVKQWGVLFDTMQVVIDEKSLGNEYKQALNNRIALSITGIGINELGNKQVSFIQHIYSIRKYISSQRYRTAVSQISIGNMPFIWKVFFICCKLRMTVAVYGMLRAMVWLRKR